MLAGRFLDFIERIDAMAGMHQMPEEIKGRLVNGRIFDHWSNPDLLALMKQLGVVTL